MISFIIMDISSGIIITIIYYICFPLISIFINGDKNVWKLSLIVYIYVLICSIPMQLGGLKAQKVNFIEYENKSNICYIYDYYGINNGLYLFKSRNKVLLIPVDKGYISYIYKKQIKL